MLIMTSIIRLGRVELPKTPIDDDSYERILTCLRIISDPDEKTEEVFLEACRKSFATLMSVTKVG